jgi:hypothetical protein
MRWSSFSLHFVSIVALAVYSSKVDAQTSVDAEIDTGVDFYSNRVEAECYIRVGKDEPYVAFNGDCRLYKADVTVAVNPLQGQAIPYPRTHDYTGYFYAYPQPDVPPEDATLYCAGFGWPEGGLEAPFWVILAHSTNSNENYYMEEAKSCEPYSAPPTVFCYSPPLFLGCPPGCMSSPYLMQWGGQNASSFVVQKLGFTGWSNWYSGTNTSSFASTGTIFDEYLKSKPLTQAVLAATGAI